MLIDAWVATGADAPMRWSQLHLDDPRPDEVLVRVHATGICHTDVLYTDGSRAAPFPLVAGHEGAGVVQAVGADVGRVRVGDHVVISFGSCGNCRACLAERPSYCADFRSINTGFRGRPDGTPQLTTTTGASVTGGFFGQSSFSTHVLTRTRNLVVIDDDIPLTVAAPLACGVQTGAGAVLNALRIGAGATVAVFGAGSVGLSAVLAAVLAGCATVTVVDPLPSRRQLAIELGASAAVHPDDMPRLHGLVPSGFDFAIDTSGRPEVIRTATAVTHSTGTIGLIASGGPGTDLSLPLRDLVVGRRLRGIVEGDSVPQSFIPNLLEQWRGGHFPVDALITRFPVTELPAAVNAMRSGSVVKPVLVFPDDSM